MLAVERRQKDWVPAEQFSGLKAFPKKGKAKTSGVMNAQAARSPPFADWAKEQYSGGSSRVLSGLKEITNNRLRRLSTAGGSK